MDNFELDPEEVVLEEKSVKASIAKGTLKMTLTSKKIMLEKQKGLLKKEFELIEVLPLVELKYFNGKPQVKQKGNDVTLQMISQNFTITFENRIDAKVFVEKVKDAATGTNVAERGAVMVTRTFGYVDDVLGIDTRETVKAAMQKGIKGALWNGVTVKKR